MLKLKCTLIASVCICLVFLLPSSGVSKNILILQVHPYLPSAELLSRFSPLVTYLGSRLESEVICKISKNYKEHIEMVGNDKVDIAFLGPVSYVKMVNKFGRKPLLARLEVKGSPLFQGVIVTHKSSSINSVKKLKGKRFAFGDPNSTMSYVVPLIVLYDQGIRPDDLAIHSFLSGHRNVALGVLMGDFDAGAVKEEVFFEYKHRGLVALEWTPMISEHLFVTKSTLPEKTIKTLRSAFLSLKDDPHAGNIMSSIKKDVSALVPVKDEHYDNLRVILRKAKNIKLINE